MGVKKYSVEKEVQIKLLNDMLLTRSFEEKVNEMFMQGQIHGTTHLCIGQEAVSSGVSNALRDNDWIQPTHRGHGHCISKSGNLNGIMAELFGKKDGHCKGIGGSMHIADISAHNMGTSGIVGGTFPISVGIGLALKRQKKDSIIACVFGDGANNEGTFHEALNLASIWKLPILYVCENNMYGMSVPIDYSMPVKNVADRGVSYNIPSKIIDGNNVLEVYEAVCEIAQHMREGNGPFLLECKTYRWLGHSKSDQRKYRTREEEKEWKDKCPIKFMKNYMIENGVITEDEFNGMKDKANDDIERAKEFAQSSSRSTLEEISELIYA
jgi:pyruvate dehydrogenase E1 component alpha subunit